MHTHLLVGASHIEITYEKLVDGWDADLIVESLKHLRLHVDDLLRGKGVTGIERPALRVRMTHKARTHIVFGVQVVADVDEVLELDGIDLLVLGRDEHGRRPDELELLAARGPLGQVPIEDADRAVQGLGLALELVVHAAEPVDEDGAHARVDGGLAPHVVPDDRAVLLLTAVLVNLPDVAGDAQRILRRQERQRGRLSTCTAMLKRETPEQKPTFASRLSMSTAVPSWYAAVVKASAGFAGSRRRRGASAREAVAGGAGAGGRRPRDAGPARGAGGALFATTAVTADPFWPSAAGAPPFAASAGFTTAG